MRRRRKKGSSGFNVWRSYSDMMAGLLLLFVLIMCVTLFQAQKSYDESIKERDERIAMQEQVLEPLRAQNYVVVVPAKSSERTVFALEKFTIPDDKQLVIEVAEKDGGRHQSFVVENEDIVRANVIDELSIQ